MDNTHSAQPAALRDDEASSGSEGQQDYDYEGQTKSTKTYEVPVAKDIPRKFKVKDRVRMRVEEESQGFGKAVLHRVFDVHAFSGDRKTGWSYQLLDVNTGALHKDGQWIDQRQLNPAKR